MFPPQNCENVSAEIAAAQTSFEEAELADPDDYIRQKHGKDFNKFQKEIRPDGQIVYTLRETVCYIYEFNEI